MAEHTIHFDVGISGLLKTGWSSIIARVQIILSTGSRLRLKWSIFNYLPILCTLRHGTVLKWGILRDVWEFIDII